MKLPWKRDPADDKNVEALLAEANAASATVQAAPAPSGPFRMTVEDVFTIKGRGTVVTGKVEAGSVSVGQQISVERAGAQVGTTKVTGVEMFRKVVTTANVGDNAGLLVDGAGEDYQRGDVLT